MELITEEQPPEVITPDTENSTYFFPSESNNESKFERLRLYNRGTWKDRREENKKIRHRIDNLAIFDCLAGQLSLNPYQKSEARSFYDNLDLGRIGRPASLIAFGVCIVFVNEDVPNGSRYWPTANDTDEEFAQMQDNLGFSDTQILSVIGIVSSRRP